MRFIPCGALDRDRTLGLIARMAQTDERDGFGIWPVVHVEDRRIIGECGITYIPEHGRALEVAWIFARGYHGRGYAREAASAVLDWAFKHVRPPQISALVDRENAPSIRLANALQMRYEGIIRAYKRDLMRYVTLTPSA